MMKCGCGCENISNIENLTWWQIFKNICGYVSCFGKNVSLLAIRILLAYGFYEPGMTKLKNVDGSAEWFATLLPLGSLSVFSVYFVGVIELLALPLFILGIGSRYLSIPLVFTMLVAIFGVHFDNGFPASDNGYEIALYYVVFLCILIFFGSGKFSLDHLVKIKFKK